MPPTKDDLRRPILTRRAALDPATVDAAAAGFADRLGACELWRDARVPCVYIAAKGEASTWVLLERLFAAGRTAVVPRVDGDRVTLRRIAGFDELAPGRFGIPEPAPTAPTVAPGEVDVVVVPGVAFDRRGHRIGYGKGYYDRLLAEMTAPAIALAYDFQLVDAVPDEAHDRPVDLVMTPTETIACLRGEGPALRSD